MFKAHIRKVKTIEGKPKYNMWQNTAWMIGNAWRTKKSVLWLCGAMILIRLADNIIGLFMTPSILRTLENASPIQEVVITILFFLGGGLILDCLSTYVDNNTMFGRIEVRVKIINKINYKAMTTSYPNTIVTEKNQLIKQAYNNCGGNGSPTEAIWDTLRQTAGHSISFVIFLAMLSYVNPILMAVSLLSCLLDFFMSRHLNNWWYENREEDAAYASRLNYVVNMSKDTSYAKDIRLFGMRKWLQDIYDSTMNLYRKFLLKGERNGLKGDVLRISLNLLRNGAAYAVLIVQALNNGLSASEFLLYFSIVGEFTGMLSSVFGDFAGLHRQSLELSRLREMLEMEEPFKYDEGERLIPDIKGKYEFTFKNVSFRYPGAEADTIHNLNMTVKAGEKLAIVGLNGAGKTTLVKLMCGLLDATEGCVLINGEDIKKFDRRDIYRHFCAVFQEFSILSMSLEENVSMQENGIDYEKLADVIEKAGLTEKIASLEHGYKTQIGRDIYEDGVLLSGGETQRLMLARALYKDAPVMILDEPTAALDPIAESDLYNKYSDMTCGRTSVYISHRLASTRFCDRIIYLENGTIIEEGSHDGLMKKGGKYRELFDIQSKYYKEGVEDNGEE